MRLSALVRRAAAAALLLALAAPSASAQLVPQLDLGVAGGLNFANLGDATGFETDNSTGYHIGLYADVGFLIASARTGVYYVSAGDIQPAGGVTVGDPDRSFSYVAVPVDVQIKTPTPVVQAYALVGPEARFPVDGLDTFDTESMTYAANVGAGVRGGVPLIGPSGFLELRYSRDLSGINSDGGGNNDVKVHLVMVRAGFGI